MDKTQSIVLESIISELVVFSNLNKAEQFEILQNISDNIIESPFETKRSEFTVKNGVLKRYKGASPVIMIPKNISEIKEEAFSGCSYLRTVIINRGAPLIGRKAFCNCHNLLSVSINESVAGIGDSAFSGCYSLIDIRLPENIKEINEKTFYFCTNLEQIIIPASIVIIHKEAFRYCINLKNIYFFGTPEQWNGITLCEHALPESASVHYISNRDNEPRQQ